MGRKSFLLIAFLTLTLLSNYVLVQAACAEASNVDEYVSWVGYAMSFSKTFVRDVSSFDPRFPGYPGYYRTINYVLKLLKEMGVPGDSIRLRNFTIVVPYEEVCYIDVGGERFKAHALYPNLGFPVITPKPITSQLVYVGKGFIEGFGDKDVNGKLVVMDVEESEYSWAYAAILGAKAVIFLDYGNGTRFDYMTKFVNTLPLNFPRVVVFGEDARRIKELAESGKEATLVCRVVWKRVTLTNIYVTIEGVEYPDEVVAVTVPLDTWSATPSKSPGAEDALSLATALAMVKYFLQHPPRRTLMFIFASGHYLALAGERVFIEDIFEGREKAPRALLSIALHSDTRSLAVIYNGYFHGDTWYSLQIVKNVPSFLFNLYHVVESGGSVKAVGVLADVFRALNWDVPPRWAFAVASMSPSYSLPDTFTYMTGDYLVGSELYTIAGGVGLALISAYSLHIYAYTPNDTPDKIIWKNLPGQFAAAIAFVDYIQGADRGKFDSAFPQPSLHRNPPLGFGRLIGRVVIYDERRDTYIPVREGDILVIAKSGWYPFHVFVNFTDPEGYFDLFGLVSTRTYTLYAMKIDYSRATLLLINDMGMYGGGRFSQTVTLAGGSLGSRDYPYYLVVFNCSMLTVLGEHFDHVVNLETFTIPLKYALFSDPTIHATVACVVPGEKYALYRGAIIFDNFTQGIYFDKYGESTTVTFVNRYVYDKLKSIVETRYSRLESKGVSDVGVSEALERIKVIEKTLLTGDNTIRQYFAFSMANTLLANVYNVVMSLIYSVSYSAIAMFALIVPAALLLERFVFGSGGIARIARIVVICGLMLGAFLAIHPSAEIASNIFLELMGVLTLIMIVPVLALISATLIRFFGEIRRKKLGKYLMEVSKLDALAVAASYSIGYSRKRPLRSVLILMAVILSCMAIVTTTSVFSIPTPHVFPSHKVAVAYSGIQIHDTLYNIPRSFDEYLELKSVANNMLDVGYRVWWYVPGYISASLTAPVYAESTGKYSEFAALLGLSYSEAGVVLPKVLIKGRSFLPNETWVAVISDEYAEELGVKVGDVINVCGLRLKVVGIFDSKKAEGIRDYAGWSYTLGVRDFANRNVPTAYIKPRNIIIVPAPALLGIAGRSGIYVIVGVSKVDDTKLYNSTIELSYLMPYETFRVGLSTGDVYVLQFGASIKVIRMEMIIIPLAMISLLILNIMLSSVYDRMREIYIFTAVGANPMHIFAIFLVEAILYAIPGVVIGYISGVGLMQLLSYMHLLKLPRGMNYTSGYILLSFLIVTAMLMLASLYPAHKASRVAVAAVERKWRAETRPKGDLWEMPMPYVFESELESVAFFIFLKKFVDMHTERIGNFMIITPAEIVREGNTWKFKCTVHLAPFDAGVQQNFELIAYEDKDGKWKFKAIMKRLSGQYSIWEKAAYRFIDTIRKQFLVWRATSILERKEYLEEAKKLIGA